MDFSTTFNNLIANKKCCNGMEQLGLLAMDFLIQYIIRLHFYMFGYM